MKSFKTFDWAQKNNAGLHEGPFFDLKLKA